MHSYCGGYECLLVKWPNTIVCTEPLVWLFSPAWDAVLLTLDLWMHLPFRGHWPYRLRGNNRHGSCSRTNDWQLSTHPQRRISAFIPMISKLACVCVCYMTYIVLVLQWSRTERVFSTCPNEINLSIVIWIFFRWPQGCQRSCRYNIPCKG